MIKKQLGMTIGQTTITMAINELAVSEKLMATTLLR
jgi:hypothetical protein